MKIGKVSLKPTESLSFSPENEYLEEPLDSSVALEPDVEEMPEAVEEDVGGDEDADEHVDGDGVLASVGVVVDQNHQLHPP